MKIDPQTEVATLEGKEKRALAYAVSILRLASPHINQEKLRASVIHVGAVQVEDLTAADIAVLLLAVGRAMRPIPPAETTEATTS